jgi:DNA-binding NarL/FixJ family response regulator
MPHSKIVIADDHPLFRTALKQAVNSAAKHVDIVEVSTMSELQDAAAEHNDADLVLLDLTMPGASGFSSLVYLKGQIPELPVMVVSGNEDQNVIRRAIDYGALGFIPKSVSLELMVEAIAAALEGEAWIPDDVRLDHPVVDDKEAKIAEGIASLTPQQFRVLVMLMQGLLNKQIAYELDVSEATVKAHVTAILRKLKVHSRTQAVIAARSLDLDSLGS